MACSYEAHRCEGCVLYLDPPYEGTTGYSGFFDYPKFWDYAREASKENVVLISEYHAQDDFASVFTKNQKTTLNNSSGSEGGVRSEHIFCLAWQPIGLIVVDRSD